MGLTERRPLKNKWKPKGRPLWSGKSTLSSRGRLHRRDALIALLTVTRTRLTVCEVGVFHNSRKYTHSPDLGAMHLSSLPMGVFSGDYCIHNTFVVIFLMAHLVSFQL